MVCNLVYNSLSLGHPHPNPLPEGEGVGGAGGVDVGGPPWRRQDVTKREMVLLPLATVVDRTPALPVVSPVKA